MLYLSLSLGDIGPPVPLLRVVVVSGTLEGEESVVNTLAGKLKERLSSYHAWYDWVRGNRADLAIIAFGALMGLMFNAALSPSNTSFPQFAYVFILACSMVLQMIVSWGLMYIRSRLFPFVVFEIGHGKKRFENMEFLRKGILGMLLFSVPMSIVAALLRALWK